MRLPVSFLAASIVRRRCGNPGPGRRRAEKLQRSPRLTF